jgi:hypothetical protein
MATVGASAVEFMVELPQEGGKCPPADAVQQGYAEVWRYVASNPPTAADFQSQSEAKKPLPAGVTACRWASCSLFVSPDGPYLALPTLRKRYKYIAKLSITANCGFTKQTGMHVDFWRFKAFKPNILGVVVL